MGPHRYPTHRIASQQHHRPPSYWLLMACCIPISARWQINRSYRNKVTSTTLLPCCHRNRIVRRWLSCLWLANIMDGFAFHFGVPDADDAQSRRWSLADTTLLWLFCVFFPVPSKMMKPHRSVQAGWDLFDIYVQPNKFTIRTKFAPVADMLTAIWLGWNE